jgi:hypothetical protein
MLPDGWRRASHNGYELPKTDKLLSQSTIGGIYVVRFESQCASAPTMPCTADPRGPKKFENSRSVQFAGSPASEQSAHHAADQATRTATTAVMVSTTPAATTGQTIAIGFVAAAVAGARR